MMKIFGAKAFCCIFLLTVGLLFVVFQQYSPAAQSTADVVTSSQLKQELRQKIVGTTTFPGEEEEYVIGYGDILGVSIYGEGDMAASGVAPVGEHGSKGGQGARARAKNGVEVRIDGRISLQHIGDVNIVGMTLTQLADYLKQLYSSVFTDPIVTTVLIQSNSRRYTVMGNVRNPGIYYLDYPINIVQALARCGGFTEWANSEITVVRQGDGLRPENKEKKGKKTLEFDYDLFKKGKELEKNIYLRSGDVMIVH